MLYLPSNCREHASTQLYYVVPGSCGSDSLSICSAGVTVQPAGFSRVYRGGSAALALYQRG